jgi:hypothetical protein
MGTTTHLAIPDRAGGPNGRVTPLAPGDGLVNTRSVLWNGVCRELAQEDLSRALHAVGNQAGVEFEVLAAPDRKVVDAIAREAVTRGADQIVLAEP